VPQAGEATEPVKKLQLARVIGLEVMGQRIRKKRPGRICVCWGGLCESAGCQSRK
jgi:hypothetical protein